MSCYAIIPARGGSKEIPHKNTRLLCGIPLIAHSIRIAKKSSLINKVIVSTDDHNIAKISAQYGAKVIIRPTEISQDNSISEDALLHALNILKIESHLLPKHLCFMQCTSPLTKPIDITEGIEKFKKEKLDSLFAAAKFHHFIWKHDNSGSLTGVNHDYRKRIMRQNLPQQYIETGSFYILNTEKFIKYKYRFFEKIGMYVLPSSRSLEIDTINDWNLVEALMTDNSLLFN